MPQPARTTIPLRKFGRADAQISALGFGGHALGEAPDEKTAVEMDHRAVDGGITFFDNWSKLYSVVNVCADSDRASDKNPLNQQQMRRVLIFDFTPFLDF
jgi:hypothetical protein